MSETSMIPRSGTQGTRSSEAKKIEVIAGQGERVTTFYSTSDVGRYPVRVSEDKKVVVVRVNTELLSRQKKIAEVNASIRRRSRS